MNKPGRLPPFKNGLRVVPYYNAAIDHRAWRIDVKRGSSEQCGVDIVADMFEREAVLLPALDHLNKRIEGWPQHPVTASQVRALASEWA